MGDSSVIGSCEDCQSIDTDQSRRISVLSFHGYRSPTGKLSDCVSVDCEEEKGTTAVPTACSSPTGHVHARTEDSPTDEHFGFFVSIAHSEASPIKAGTVAGDDSVVDYVDEHGNPEEQRVPLGVFSVGASTFGYHRAQQLQTRLAGIIMTEPSRPPWSNMLER
ncbi:hypothetical protein FOL47_010978 [Perkinsus chesapeaki]|uniref:Uncharacterized protein n=1 Tax=Perkinsus chesapeaki TaxID=330153 RepID=A0A7J6MNJ0_PERCH|nr:hypothetical protein FOL47_010978 [Perkinsus chesapeaki]